MFAKAANKNRIGEVWRICLPESMVMKVWSLGHQSNLGGHRGLEGKFGSKEHIPKVLSQGQDR